MEFLTDGILALTWQQIVMFAVGITLIRLAIKKGFEPALLLPMGFGAILVNLVLFRSFKPDSGWRDPGKRSH
mgnify:CR=1 FL=1